MNENFAPPDFSIEPCDVQEATFRWIYLGCADQPTIKDIEHHLVQLNKPIASDLAAAVEDAELWYAEIVARIERRQMEQARAAFAEYRST